MSAAKTFTESHIKLIFLKKVHFYQLRAHLQLLDNILRNSFQKKFGHALSIKDHASVKNELHVKFHEPKIQHGGLPWVFIIPVSILNSLQWLTKNYYQYSTHFAVSSSCILDENASIFGSLSYERRLSFELQVSLVWDMGLIRETSLKREVALYLVTHVMTYADGIDFTWL